ncbi:AAA family ATPase [Sphingosinicella sp. YJ22]|uniref:AAA family ATPase n=1 Tax=Sphingosinicella sp. YJ22 TaxID=1104780 RepID=UPI00140D83EA|nr:AAA family ATPase [Sphingosinicella sp. YJ22]
MTARPSLFERAAEIYDFESGLRVDPLPHEAPPAEPRPEPVEPVQPAVRQTKAAPRPARTVTRRSAEIDLAALEAGGYLLPDASSSALAEETRIIKRRLIKAIDDRAERDPRARVALIASGQPGEGKTFLALNLALSIAGEHERAVLLIDGDTSQPEIAGRLGIDPDAGLVDALADRDVDPESLVIDTDIDGLSILPAGRRERNVPELLASARTEEVLERLLAADPQRIILIDSPPALAASTASVLAGHAGQTLVVVRADTTSEADLKETVGMLGGPARLSLVLNSASLSTGGRRFGQYEESR